MPKRLQPVICPIQRKNMVTTAAHRFEIRLTKLDPTTGSEIKKTRPCIILSDEESNQYLNTVIIAPLTGTVKPYPARVKCTFQGKQGTVALDQLRTVDKRRLIKKMGTMDFITCETVCQTLQNMFNFY